MRAIQVYLGVYFALVIGAGVVLWAAGAFADFPPPWVALGLLIAVGLGLLLAAVSTRPRASVGRDD